MDVLVIADDVTGANASAAGFARRGLRAVTAAQTQFEQNAPDLISRFDVCVASTDARHVDPDVAIDRITRIIDAAWPAKLVSNRIDTTLRGNVGATTAAIRKLIQAKSGIRTVIAMFPAHPTANRQTVNGLQLVNGVQLANTDVAKDVRTPVKHSQVAKVLRQQSDVNLTVIDIETITGDFDAMVGILVKHIRDEQTEGFIFDAIDESHIYTAAEAIVAAVEQTNTTLVSVDPGPGAVALAVALGLTSQEQVPPLLVASGSATALTRVQLGQLQIERDAWIVNCPTIPGTPVPDIPQTVAVLKELIDGAIPGQAVGVATVLQESDILPVSSDGQAREISANLGAAVFAAIKENPVSGMYTTGGDVTSSILENINATGFRIYNEVMPLAVAGTVVGGPFADLPILTKGGLIGGPTAAIECIDYLRQYVQLQRGFVPSL